MRLYNEASSEAIVIPFNRAGATSKTTIGIEGRAYELRDSAVSLAREGFRIFPVVEGGKVPAIKDWQDQACDDPNRVRRFWSEAISDEPMAYNIGIVTGAGLFVLDIDNKNGKQGSATLAGLELAHGDLSPTFVVRTASGGFHYYFRAPPSLWIPNSAGKLGPGIDVRGDGGYVVGPGSIVAGGMYKPEPQL